MTAETAIRVENLSKRYTLGKSRESGARYQTLRDTLAQSAAAALRQFRRRQDTAAAAGAEEFWALKDVSFEIMRGEVVGIIGRNGAGKSTLLKILSRITDPTRGSIRTKGRVASLLEVGTGFHPELTGRENIFLNGAILGMHRHEIKAKFDEIVAFAEVGQFIDTPVKRYSSGMYVRLAFAVAAHLEPEILVVDEVLAVGDSEFQAKCLGKMKSVAQGGGRTVLFVSHNMGAVNTLCQRAIHLARGSVKEIGPTGAVIAGYYEALRSKDSQDLRTLRLAGYGKEVWFTGIQCSVDSAGGSIDSVHFGQDLVYDLEIAAAAKLRGLSIGSSVFDANGVNVGSLLTEGTFSVEPGQTLKLRLTIRNPRLAPGRYYAGCSIGQGGFSGGARQDLDIVIGQPAFEVLPVSRSENAFVSNWSPAWGNVVFLDNQLTALPG